MRPKYLPQFLPHKSRLKVQGRLDCRLSFSGVSRDANDNVRVTDFDLAKVLEQDSGLTLSGSPSGPVPSNLISASESRGGGGDIRQDRRVA